MKLDDLNNIRAEEAELYRKAKRIEQQISVLVSNRNNMKTLSEYIRDMSPSDSSFYQEISNEILKIANSMSHDVFRIVEMKFSAEARELKAEAKLKNAQISQFSQENEETK